MGFLFLVEGLYIIVGFLVVLEGRLIVWGKDGDFDLMVVGVGFIEVIYLKYIKIIVM